MDLHHKIRKRLQVDKQNSALNKQLVLIIWLFFLISKYQIQKYKCCQGKNLPENLFTPNYHLSHQKTINKQTKIEYGQ